MSIFFPQGAAPTPSTLIFDFDGTVSQGHGPVLAYAQEIADAARIPQIFEQSAQVLNDPARSTNEPIQIQTNDVVYYPVDGYDLVRRIAARFDVGDNLCQFAYMRSRERLADTGITTPAGLREFLAEYPERKVLATNAPTVGLDAALETLGLKHAFDAVYTSVGKPAGLHRLLNEDFVGESVVGIGDIWDNDLAPVAAQGGQTVLIATEFAAPPANPTWSVAHLSEIYPVLMELAPERLSNCSQPL